MGPARWKYALSLPLSDPGFHFSILSDFRKRLVDGQVQDFALQHILDFCKREGYIKTNSKQRTDSTHVLARIRRLNRLTLVGETLRAALNEWAELHPEWLLEIMPRLGENGTSWDKRHCLGQSGTVLDQAALSWTKRHLSGLSA